MKYITGAVLIGIGLVGLVAQRNSEVLWLAVGHFWPLGILLGFLVLIALMGNDWYFESKECPHCGHKWRTQWISRSCPKCGY